MKAYRDPDHPGNSTKHRTGRPCFEAGCQEPAGTSWSPFWCFAHNVARMDRIDAQFDGLEADLAAKGGDR